MPTYHLITYGCQMNEFDSEVLAKMAEDQGFTPLDNPDEADLLIFNTCAVRERAEEKFYGRLGQLKSLKDRNPDLKVAVCGCVAQKEAGEIRQKFPYVDLIIGTRDLQDFGKLLSETRRTSRRQIAVQGQGDELELVPKRKSSLTAWVPVSSGCNLTCTFCVVRFLRGPLRSRDPQAIYREVEKLADENYKEITLLGQNVNSYGVDLSPRVEFAALLERLSEIKNLKRLRFVAPYPKRFTPRLIQAVKELPAVCEQVHLPLQSGDDQVLRRMRRGYKAEDFLRLVHLLKEEIPYLALTTDIIVGFPGETEEQFKNTLKLVEDARFDNAFMFAYSPREGTEAAVYPDQIPLDVQKDRLYRLIDLQNRITGENRRKALGRVVEVLVEGPSDKNPEKSCGRTRGNQLVVLEGKPEKTGEFLQAELTEAFIWGWKGKVRSEKLD